MTRRSHRAASCPEARSSQRIRTPGIRPRVVLGWAGAAAVVVAGGALAAATFTANDEGSVERRLGVRTPVHRPACGPRMSMFRCSPPENLGAAPTPESFLIFERCDDEWTGDIAWMSPGEPSSAPTGRSFQFSAPFTPAPKEHHRHEDRRRTSPDQGPRDGGRRGDVRPARRGHPAGVRPHHRQPHPPHPRAPRAGRRAHGRGLRPRHRPARRVHGDLGPGGHQRGHPCATPTWTRCPWCASPARCRSPPSAPTPSRSATRSASPGR